MNGRDKRRLRAQRGRVREAMTAVCPNCKGPGLHFVPPSLGERGYYICSAPATVGPGCCDACNGTGGTSDGPCPDCYATGHPHPEDEDCPA